jgi:succinate dehydrogenase subunit C
MTGRLETLVWAVQRATAVVLAFCVLVHLVTIIYAVRAGLSAGAILARTQGSILWGTFYGVFVIAVAIHAVLGMRVIAAEWLGLRGPGAEVVVGTFGVLLAVTGLRAVVAVVGA